MCLAFGVEQPRRRRREARRRARDAAAGGARRQAARAQAAEVDRRLAAERRAQGRLPGDRPPRRRGRPRRAAGADLLAARRGAVHHAAGGDHARPARPASGTSACTGCRCSARARPRCTGSCTRTAAPTSRAAGGRMEVAVALGLDPVTAYSASAPLPKHIDELMFAGFLRGEAVDVVKGVTVDLEVPADGRDRARGLRRAGRPRRRRARSATTPATTRRPSRSRSSTSPR